MEYPRNRRGQTYGPLSKEAGPVEDLSPDLILSHGDGGTIGYIASVDLNSGFAQTLEQAEKMAKESPKAKVLKLYAEDGETVIGTKTVGA